MSARSAAVVLVVLAVVACAGPTTSRSERATESPSERARPDADPALLGTPQGAPDVLPIEQVAVRVTRGPDGRATIVEFLSPGLTEEEQVALRLAFEQGKLQPASQGSAGEGSWITTLPRSR